MAARNANTAVGLECIVGRVRQVKNAVVAKIDLKIARGGYYDMLNLQPYMKDLQCWERRKVVSDLRRGLPSGTVELWSWMPGGGRAGIASYVIWKVGPPFVMPACILDF